MTDIKDCICNFPNQAKGFRFKDIPLSIVIDIVKNENWYKEDDENFGARNTKVRKCLNDRIEKELQKLLDNPQNIIIWWGSHYGKKLGQLEKQYFNYVKNNEKMFKDEDCDNNEINEAVKNYMYSNC